MKVASVCSTLLAEAEAMDPSDACSCSLFGLASSIAVSADAAFSCVNQSVRCSSLHADVGHQSDDEAFKGCLASQGWTWQCCSMAGITSMQRASTVSSSVHANVGTMMP